MRNGTWGRPDVSQCQNLAFTAIRASVSEKKLAIIKCTCTTESPKISSPLRITLVTH